MKVILNSFTRASTIAIGHRQQSRGPALSKQLLTLIFPWLHRLSPFVADRSFFSCRSRRKNDVQKLGSRDYTFVNPRNVIQNLLKHCCTDGCDVLGPPIFEKNH
ncbi:hypothetical protein L596_000700 [Steinernema carpocapsae]|uniref:Uncharacterized protein n=1 Tax=Steinernema carpocapsae TaxID=34508 RepID=A0A4U8ULB5_STECR|nr:hypothetical protein L596_000700 [Steinernema carpocapsae]